jgi:hypothetical protein
LAIKTIFFASGNVEIFVKTVFLVAGPAFLFIEKTCVDIRKPYPYAKDPEEPLRRPLSRPVPNRSRVAGSGTGVVCRGEREE